MLILTLLQIIISLLLLGVILLQSKGAGLGRAWGGEAGFYHTKRGMEKLLFILTIVLAVLFFTISILNFIVGQK